MMVTALMLTTDVTMTNMTYITYIRCGMGMVCMLGCRGHDRYVCMAISFTICVVLAFITSFSPHIYVTFAYCSITVRSLLSSFYQDYIHTLGPLPLRLTSLTPILILIP